MQRFRSVALGAATLAAGFFMQSTAKATDAEWGCQVLLCAASSNPSWRGVPYCVPPMVRLISAMARPHFSWPICPGAGTGAPGYEKYGDCPEGYSVGYSSSDSDHHWNREPDRCVKVIDRCAERRHFYGDDGGWCIETISQPRPVRPHPYYFDIRQASGTAERFWFELNR